MEKLGFYDYFEDSKILAAYERSLGGTTKDADVAIKA
jgi:hypothetical protein